MGYGGDLAGPERLAIEAHPIRVVRIRSNVDLCKKPLAASGRVSEFLSRLPLLRY